MSSRGGGYTGAALLAVGLSYNLESWGLLLGNARSCRIRIGRWMEGRQSRRDLLKASHSIWIRIVLPLLGAVGLSSWIASPQRFSKSIGSKVDSLEEKPIIAQQAIMLPTQNKQVTSMDTADPSQELCKIESSLCVYDANDENMFGNLTVAEAMKTNYFSVSMTTSLVEALDLMIAEKQPFVMVTESNTYVIGLLELKNIQDFCRAAKTTRAQAEVKEFLVSHVYQAGKCKWCSVTPQMPLTTAEKIMDSHGVDHLPVVSEHANLQEKGLLIGFVDRECIAIARRALAVKEFFSSTYEIGKEERPRTEGRR